MTDLIVDSNSLYARCWYATHEDAYETVKMFSGTIFGLLDPERIGSHVDRTMFCWDGGQKRPKERAERPPEYEGTKPRIKRILEDILGSVNERIQGYEADDVIATAAFASPADTVVVVSGDKDLYQLQGGNILYYDLNSRGFVSSREIVAKWRVRRPSHVAIALAVKGDPVDKIPGIRGWGMKKVEKLFEHIRSDMAFDNVLNAIEAQIPPDKVPEFYESLELTLLNSGVPGVREPQPVRLAEADILEDYGLEDCYGTYSRILSAYS